VNPTSRVQQDSRQFESSGGKTTVAETVAFFKIQYRHDKVGKWNCWNVLLGTRHVNVALDAKTMVHVDHG